MKETLVFRTKKIADIAWDVKYKIIGYRKLTDPIRKWNWKRLCFEWEMIVEQPEPKHYVIDIDNQSEINTHKHRFSYCAPDGSLYVKNFYFDPNNQAGMLADFEEWKKAVSYII